MKSVAELENLVFGDRRPDALLNVHGTIHPTWFGDYERSLGDALSASDGETWPRALVQAAHWTSFYLPLRLHVALATRTVDPAASEGVTRVHLATERMLLASLATHVSDDVRIALKSEQPLPSAAHELIRLSFGRGSPASRSDDDASIQDWRDRFERCWKIVSVMMLESSNWPKWTTAAAHFASFYVDLLLRRKVGLDDWSRAEAIALAGILPCQTLALIDQYLRASNLPRDNTGLPMLGEIRSSDRFSVRRLVEPVLLARAEPKGSGWASPDSSDSK